MNGGQNIAVAVLFSAVGFVIVRRQPRNAIGWILLTVPAGLQLLPADAASYALLAYRLGHHLPFGAVALLLEYSWAPAIVLLGLAILLSPDGRLPSPRWRPVLVVLPGGGWVLRGGHVCARWLYSPLPRAMSASTQAGVWRPFRRPPSTG